MSMKEKIDDLIDDIVRDNDLWNITDKGREMIVNYFEDQLIKLVGATLSISKIRSIIDHYDEDWKEGDDGD